MKRRIEDKFIVLLKLLAIGAIVALVAMVASIALADTLNFPDKNTMIIEGEIDGSLFGMAEELLEKAKDKKQFNLIISSPGGSIVAGMIFIEAMQRAQERGTKFVCIVDKMALSMGFVILAACDYRYIMETSLLLFHPARVEMRGYSTAKNMKTTAKQLNIYNEYIDSLIRPVLNISDKLYKDYGDNDMIMTGVHIMKISPKFAVIVDDFVITVPKKSKKVKDKTIIFFGD